MKTAVYSTLYPAMLPYLKPFWQSILAQTDQDFDLVLGIDQLDTDTVNDQLSGRSFTVVRSTGNATVLRQEALRHICQNYDAVILVDSDDVLLPSRVSAAKAALADYDAYGCALELIDAQGQALDLRFGPTEQQDWASFLVSVNVFGFSNTAYRCTLLQDCLDMPSEVVMMDWLVISQALVRRARLFFDAEPHMLYRQYPDNTARVLAPYSAEQLRRATGLVGQHYAFSRAAGISSAPHVRRAEEVARFAESIDCAEQCGVYLQALNALKPIFYWWECVAHPELESLWS